MNYVDAEVVARGIDADGFAKRHLPLDGPVFRSYAVIVEYGGLTVACSSVGRVHWRRRDDTRRVGENVPQPPPPPPERRDPAGAPPRPPQSGDRGQVRGRAWAGRWISYPRRDPPLDRHLDRR